MIPHPESKTPPPAGTPVPAKDIEPRTQPYALLRQAAEAAAQVGMPPDAFAAAAWQAYMVAAPEVAQRLADLQLDAALEELRKSGRLAKA